MKNLIGAILLQAVKDLENENFKDDVKDFFASDWFLCLADELELNSRSVREQISSGSYQRVNIRATYR